jgi:long-chain acyl-CoA synthetase
LHTGDVGFLDAEGCLYLRGRMRNIILVRGFTVYAEEIENSLLSSGFVKECVVYGKADDLGNETVCADIVPASTDVTAEDIEKWCSEKLAQYKKPQNIRLLGELEKTATGKPKRI